MLAGGQTTTGNSVLTNVPEVNLHYFTFTQPMCYEGAPTEEKVLTNEPDVSTLNHITRQMCYRDLLSTDEYTQCVNTITSSYFTNRDSVPNSLRAVFDSDVVLITRLLFISCGGEEMRTIRSQSGRNSVCFPIGNRNCEGETPTRDIAKCAYQAVNGERIDLLETDKPISIPNRGIFTYLGAFGEFARMLGGTVGHG